MRKKLIFGLLFLALCLAACGGEVEPTVGPTPVHGQLTFAGSTTVQPLAGILGEHFQGRYPEVTLDIAAGGSSVGIQAVHNGTVDIGMASRELDADEAAGIEVHRIAIDVLAVIVHPDNPLENLTRQQLQDIYLGRVSNWKQVGGDDQEIVVVIRETTSGTRGAFDNIVLGGAEPAASGLEVAITAGDVAAIVADRPAAVGYVGFGNLEENVKLVAIDGLLPSPEAAREGRYTLVRPLQLLTGPLSQPLAQLFVEFATGPEGQRVVQESGWIPAR
ncbi:MAG: phosphate ABC transporter substrate-binding protein [Chloroflexia bacterium]|nr:phosphate ABC transporter substrate-binding protein [Chloroflexia bacterium]